MATLYPIVNSLRELKCSLSQFRLNDLAVGNDGRNRCPLWSLWHEDCAVCAFHHEICLRPCQVVALHGRAAIAVRAIHRDYKQQEVRIAAIVGGDGALLAACESGDVYLGIAEQIGLLREACARRNATRSVT